MSELKSLLKAFINDIDNPVTNAEVADYYYALMQFASALTFYLRCAERTDNTNLQYYCLIKMGKCLENTGKRVTLVKSCFNHAINIDPTRPEAYYFLSRNYERNKEWIPSYTIANIGLQVADDSKLDKFSTALEYTGKWNLLFEKAVAAWWWGKSNESRELFYSLNSEYYDQLDEIHKKCVKTNITAIGAGHVPTYYTSDNYNKLRFKFNNSVKINRNHSQVFQDMFVLSMLDGKRHGTYLEIGSADPMYGNNTYLLEKLYNWTGIGLDYNLKFVEKYKTKRKNKVLLANALEVDYNALLEEIAVDNTIDYLQLDCEPAEITYAALLKIPFNKYKFAVITYEHDYYADSTKSFREKSREYLKNLGYLLVVNDICADDKNLCNFEDWWVHPELVDTRILSIMSDNNLNNYKNPQQYMYTTNTYNPFIQLVETDVTTDDLYSINSKKKNRIIVVDNFYKNPDKVREFALKQEYIDGGFGIGYIGHRTNKQFLFPGLQDAFENLLGKKITAWEEHGMNGRFQYCTEGQPLVYHCDDQTWAGMLFLTPNAPYESGTSFWAIKNSDIRDRYHKEIKRGFRDGAQNLDKTLYEQVDRVGNIYNRLVLFDASLIHSANEYFGWNKDNGRLWHMFFFD